MATATTEIYTYVHTLSLHDALPTSMGASEPAAAKMPTVTSPTAMKIRSVPSPMRLASLVAGVPQGVILVTWTVQVHAAVVKPGGPDGAVAPQHSAEIGREHV